MQAFVHDKSKESGLRAAGLQEAARRHASSGVAVSGDRPAGVGSDGVTQESGVELALESLKGYNVRLRTRSQAVAVIVTDLRTRTLVNEGPHAHANFCHLCLSTAPCLR